MVQVPLEPFTLRVIPNHQRRQMSRCRIFLLSDPACGEEANRLLRKAAFGQDYSEVYMGDALLNCVLAHDNVLSIRGIGTA
jgi:hypothetical protein